MIQVANRARSRSDRRAPVLDRKWPTTSDSHGHINGKLGSDRNGW